MEVPFSYSYLVKMETIEKRFQLRGASDVCATLCVHPNRTNTLEHSLSPFQVEAYGQGGLAISDRTGRPCTLHVGDKHLSLATPGDIPLRIPTTITDGNIVADVKDPKDQVQLVVDSASSTGKDGGWVFNLRWIAPRS